MMGVLKWGEGNPRNRGGGTPNSPPPYKLVTVYSAGSKFRVKTYPNPSSHLTPVCFLPPFLTTLQLCVAD